ncbi:hypothetical protein [Streptomyces sp. NPDC021020]|uniref:DUF7660 family protein n=1 Tax=Streptomyces sp. NPDC021020 TaxID=3365109 RepID=UPI00378E82D8
MTLPREPGVRSREELALYVDELLAEFRQRGDAWENATLERFLDALAACVRAHGREAPGDAPAEWGYLAFVLGAATVYE